MPRYILGISCFYHDAAAALLKDGQLVAAAEEERFTRKKHDASFPKNAVAYCLAQQGITINDVEMVGYYEKPFLVFERLLQTYIHTWPKGITSFLSSMPTWLKKKLWSATIIREQLGYAGVVYQIEHHMAHAASSFLPSPFSEAAILTVDGVGEWATATMGVGTGTTISLQKELHFPHSLGLLYSAFTYYLGFTVNSAEYKVMGLAPYGTPRYTEQILSMLMDLKEDGSFALDMSYFSYEYGLRMTNKKFDALFGAPARLPESPLEQRHKDIAASLQKATEEIVLRMVRFLHKETGLTNLCMAGGVALNCVANGRIQRETPCKNIFVQPAAGDAGGAVGTAFYLWNVFKKEPRTFALPHTYWGPEYADAEIQHFLDEQKIPYERFDRAMLLDRTAQVLEEQSVVGWFQGRMEFGPRSLGNRSILADPRNAENWQRVNQKIKFRESFRPFAPAVLEESTADWFVLDVSSPYMLLVAQVRPEKRTIPAVTHVDGSARVQTVHVSQNPLFHDLIARFGERTGTPVVINTSFNVRGEPIVCNYQDAYACFRRTDMDVLVLGSFFISKRADLPPFADRPDWREALPLD
ncbi:carbamoyltransferase [Patescibacteria group bacterium]|nr:carbamoyltransferase [Patescibacteria group bacterium]